MKPSTQMQERSYKPLEMCMYCNATKCNLTREHLIPEGIGGKWSLPSAVCDECKAKVNPDEAIVVKDDLHSIRVALEIRRKRHAKKERTKGPLLPRKIGFWPVGVIGPRSGELDFQPGPGRPVPSLSMVQFKPPSRMPGHERPESEHGVRLATVNLNEAGTLAPGDYEVREPARIWEFAYCLAKWAYGFAVAERGIGCCDTTDIRALLLGQTRDAMSFAGAYTGPALPRSQWLHWMSIREVDGLLVVCVQLFGSAGFSPYDVVVGRIA